MAKSLQYVKIFETLQAAKGPVPVSTIKALDGIVPTRLSTYLWEIKKNTGFAVKANRDGRSVVSYELVGSGTAPVVKAPVAKVAAPSKVAKPAKAVKSTKPVAKATKSNMAQDSIQSVMPAKSGPIDILDEIDTQIEDFEDRQFASDYIRGAV
jgi:hypothetical protein